MSLPLDTFNSCDQWTCPRSDQSACSFIYYAWFPLDLDMDPHRLRPCSSWRDRAKDSLLSPVKSASLFNAWWHWCRVGRSINHCDSLSLLRSSVSASSSLFIRKQFYRFRQYQSWTSWRFAWPLLLSPFPRLTLTSYRSCLRSWFHFALCFLALASFRCPHPHWIGRSFWLFGLHQQATVDWRSCLLRIWSCPYRGVCIL